MVDNMYSMKDYAVFYTLVRKNTQDIYAIHHILRLLLEDVDDEKLVKDVIARCLQTVAVFEHVQAAGHNDDLWEAFSDKLEFYDYNKNNFINPLNNATKPDFRLKCIATIKEIRANNFKSMKEAVYEACTSEKYLAFEKTIIQAIEARERSEDKHKFFGMVMAMLLVTELFPVSFILGLPDALSYVINPGAKGALNLLCGYCKNKKALLPKKPEYDVDPNTDYSQEYFDPTYVNM